VGITPGEYRLFGDCLRLIFKPFFVKEVASPHTDVVGKDRPELSSTHDRYRGP